MIKTVLFDLDGTLLDTEPDFTRILNEQLARHGRAPIARERVRQVVSSGARAMVAEGFGVEEDDPAFAPLLEEFLGLYDDVIPRTQCLLFKDMEKLLERLCEAGLNWGIVTNKPSRFTIPLLARLEALKDCGVVVCRDQLRQAKPHPEGLLLACEKAGSRTEESVYVGDHPRDIEAGRNAGMLTVAAAWGYIPEGSDVRDWQADFVARDVKELERILFEAMEGADV